MTKIDSAPAMYSFVEYLHLEEGEYLFSDIECWFRVVKVDVDSCKETVPSKPSSQISTEETANAAGGPDSSLGRLQITTRNLYFIPDTNNTELNEILKVSYGDVVSVDQNRGDVGSSNDIDFDTGGTHFVVAGRGCTNISINGSSPWICYDDCIRVEFFFTKYDTNTKNSVYALLEKVLEDFRQGHRDEETTLESVRIKEYEQSIEFNQDDIVSNKIPVIFKTRGKRIAPMIEQPGWIALTYTAIYFQPYFRKWHSSSAVCVPLLDLKRVARKKHQIQPNAVELFFDNHLFGPETMLASRSLLLITESQVDCEKLAGELAKLTAGVEMIPHEKRAKKKQSRRVMKQWRKGKMSNFKYIMELNHIAGRTFNDISQYPVFPWVINDFSSQILDLSNPATFRDLSRPIVALNSERVSKGKEMYDLLNVVGKRNGETEPAWQHGSHFSYPGGVIFYLARSCPQMMLKLYSGEFDSPDRQFFSIGSAWDSVRTYSSDIKELIPEFYMPEVAGGFLLNRNEANFGLRKTNQPISDVELPPWANSPENFAAQMRDALESPYVSMELHHWVDLVFGQKSRGKAAVKANNLFHYLTYDEM